MVLFNLHTWKKAVFLGEGKIKEEWLPLSFSQPKLVYPG